MPELPDITVYVERIAAKAQGAVLRELKLHDAFVLRTAVPPVANLEGLRVVDVRRLGKRVVLGFAGEGQATPRLFLVIHLMIAGRLHWLAPGKKPPGHALATLTFDDGQL
ncbi:MAG TPA: DNA-formamidopyrimidine glycosylase family protein, partial [Burkholderiaceae bacterium]